MAKLVILNQGMTGRAHELNVERTTIGRVEDNTFQITDPSVSSHHCEVLLRGSEVLIHDLNSTNGSFINGEKISETILKPGQTLRLGQVELRLETADASAQSAPAASSAAPATAPAPGPKKQVDATMVMPRGVSLSELDRSGTGGRPVGFDSTTAFSKKKKQNNKLFLIIGIVVAAVIVIGILVLVLSLGGNSHK
ncbi:MAG TPA: FHA domain-containing protein [Verrucomicrobiae bacterium]|nr:FHA domain-containing protein [Verrucomicrobiae bacterium]